jgi:uncharacterized protein (DUF58 family)
MIVARDPERPTTREQLLDPAICARLDKLDLFSRKILAGKLPGERRSKRRGRSVEFDDFRQYVAGDDLRHIDWNVFARLDRLFIKLFREEEDLAMHIIVDASASMDAGVPSKLNYAFRLAISLAYIGLVNQNRVSVSMIGVPRNYIEDGNVPRGTIRQLAAVRGRGSLARVSGFLLGALGARARAVSGGEESSLNDELYEVSRRGRARGIVVVLSDFLCAGGCARGLGALAAVEPGAVDTFCLQILSPGEIDPGAEESAGLFGDLRLTDVETMKVTEVTMSRALLARYAAAFAAYNERLRADCLSRGLAHFRVPTSTPVQTLVLDSLRRGGMLR